jgi:hypothetical protein
VITHCNILDFQNERWFNKISAHEAINVLTAGKNGSFLFRPSSAPGYLSMSYNKDQVIHHVRVQVTNDGFICEGDELIYSAACKRWCKTNRPYCNIRSMLSK